MDNQALPENACDCHMHLFDPSFPVIPNASLSPSPATLEDYAEVQSRLGIQRFVIVQPSIYGLDNSLLLQSLREVGAHRARGVAVVNSDVTESELSDLFLSGVRGVRFNQVQNGVTSMEMLAQLDGRLNERNMHVQFHAPPKLLIESESVLTSLRSSVVIDHIGRFASMPEVRAQVEAVLVRLLKTRRVWLKLSGPYLASRAGAPYEDIEPFILELTRDFPDRLVWGSDWPHATEKEEQDDKSMMVFFRQLMPSSKVDRLVFAANAEELYGFTKNAAPAFASS